MGVRIVFEPLGKRGEFNPGVSLIEAARRVGIRISSLCGGRGVCGKCKVKVIDGRVSEVTESEQRLISGDELMKGYRLACQLKIYSDSTIYIPKSSLVGYQRMLVEGLKVRVKLNPLVKKYYLELPKPSISDQIGDDCRILRELEKIGLKVDFEFTVLKDLPELLRRADWRVTVTVWGEREIISVEEGDTREKIYGFACDIGTTKIAGKLIDLSTGEELSASSTMNPQIQLGEDLITRIQYVVERGTDGLIEAQRLVTSAINELINDCCRKAGVSPDNIYELCFVGNTGMQCLFLGIWPKFLALSPYTPPRKRSVTASSRNLGLNACKNAKVFFLPVIGGFVGADNVAVLMATDLLKSKETCMAIDVGTNTEIDLCFNGRVMADSCASGPAFEGMSIKHGMRAASGAIERISIDPESYDVAYETIGGEPPVGLCGSALIDALAELLKAGLIDLSGAFNHELAKQTKRLRRGEDGAWEFVVAWSGETGTGEDIVITQRDIRELQKAKAAMHTGAAILMKRLGVKSKEIKKLFIAGAFGNYLNPDNARVIGMIPEVPLSRIRFIGNAALTGAEMALTSREMREYSEEIAEKVVYFELASDPDFQEEFLNSTFLPHRDLSKFPETRKLLEDLGVLESK